MAAIQNERTLRLQATVPRIIPVPIPIDQVEGLPEAIAGATGIKINASGMAFTRSGATTNPATITLTAEVPSSITGSVTWSVIAGGATLTPSGAGNRTCSVNGASVLGFSVTVQAAVGGKTAQITLTKFGALSAQDAVNLATQVTNQLANSNVTGLGALALLNTVNLNTQVTGALNGVTQVTNLGALAYAEGLAANQIGAGTLAAGVIYAGNINAAQVTAGTFTGRQFRTAASGERAQMDVDGTLAHRLRVFNSSGTEVVRLGAGDSSAAYSFMTSQIAGSNGYTLEVRNTNASSGNALLGASTVGVGISGQTSSGVGVQGYASGPGTGVQAQGGTLDLLCANGVMRLTPRSTFPTGASALAGTIILHATHGLCFTDGTSWAKVTITPV